MNISILMMVFTSGLFFSCSILQGDPNDAVLVPYVTDATLDMGLTESDLYGYTIIFKTLSEVKSDIKAGTVIGQCDHIAKIITVDPTYWFSAYTTERDKVSLIRHELGHCICKLSHNKAVMPDRCPASLMTPTTLSRECLIRHWENYTEELKTGCE